MNDPIQHTKKSYGRSNYREMAITFFIILIQIIAGFVFLVTTIALGVYLGHALI